MYIDDVELLSFFRNGTRRTRRGMRRSFSRASSASGGSWPRRASSTTSRATRARWPIARPSAKRRLRREASPGMY